MNKRLNFIRQFLRSANQVSLFCPRLSKLGYLFLLFAFFSCVKEPDFVENEKEATVVSDVVLSYGAKIDGEQALNIALKAPKLFGELTTKSVLKTISNSELVLDGLVTKGQEADTLMYIINYAEGGYVFIPTDNLDGEIVAYVEQGAFQMSDTTENKLQAFLVDAMMNYRRAVRTLAANNENNLENGSDPADGLLSKGATGEIGDNPGMTSALIRDYRGSACGNVLKKYRNAGNYGDPVLPPPREALTASGMDYNDEYYKTQGCYMSLTYYDESTSSRSPLLTTSWWQYGPFNNNAPKIGDEHACAGCVAIAVTQIMAYYAYPERFPADIHNGVVTSLASLRNRKYSADFSILDGRTVATFVRTVGDLLGNKWNIYPIGTNASDSKVGSAFVRMGYPTSLLNYLGYNYDCGKSVNALNDRRPIYISGSSVSGGHAWVMDGYKFMSTSSEQCTAYFDKNSTYNGKKRVSISSRTMRYFHHNFGWHGQANGYYLDGVFDTSRTFEVTGTPTLEKNYHNYQKITIMPNITKF